MSFSLDLRLQSTKIWESIESHPFVQGIGNATLPIDNFRYYMCQDYIFLIGFSRVISLACSKANTLDEMKWFANLNNETLNVEMNLHVSFCKDFGISKDDLESTQPSHATRSYLNHLLSTAYSGDSIDSAIAILPCSWGYSEIGKTLSKYSPQQNQFTHLYQRWIQMYSSEEFEQLALWLKNFIDKNSENFDQKRKKILSENFLSSCHYEYQFWESAFNMSV